MDFKKFNKFISDLLFPQYCLGCHKQGTLLCDDCFSLIEISEYQFCPFCREPKRVFDYGKCDKHKSKKLDGLFVATDYENALVKKIIYKFKYEPFLKSLAVPLAKLIISHISLSESESFIKSLNPILIPIPLHPFRKKWRGYNQSELIAKELSKFYNFPLVSDALIRKKKTISQTKLSKEERIKNIANAFTVKNQNLIEGKNILLVDDVFTSGATMEEGAKALKANGAKKVWGVAVAREMI